MDLANKKCIPCEGGVPPLKGEELDLYLEKVAGWQVFEGKKIYKEFKFPDFEKALAFVNQVGRIAEEEGHHPDVRLSWGKVLVELSTHAISGLSENDFILAAKIDKIS